MIPFIQSATLPNCIPLAFDQATASPFVEARWAVAYITDKGSRHLVGRLEQRNGARWKNCRKEFVTSCDYGITEPEAIEFLQTLPNSTVKIASKDVLNRPGFKPLNAFHPKLYLFQSATQVNAIVGSANLTVRALTTNQEAVTLQTGMDIAPWLAAWSTLTAGAEDFTPALLAQYRQKRRGQPPPVDIDPPAQPPPTVTGSIKNFWDEVLAKRLAPLKFDHLWIEAGSMSSSASHNQLELPRGGNRFFGFTFSDYDDQQRRIGYPQLIVSGAPYSNRKLMWHGDNRMERIYLPTENQSGLRYQDQVILFRRVSAGYELEVFASNSAADVACRAASQQLGRVYSGRRKIHS